MGVSLRNSAYAPYLIKIKISNTMCVNFLNHLEDFNLFINSLIISSKPKNV